MNEDIINRLKEVMREKGLSQSQLAEDLGLTQGTLSLYLSGKNSPKKFMIVAMGYEMGINPEWLLTGQGEIFRNSEENIPDLPEYFFINRRIKEIKTLVNEELTYVNDKNKIPNIKLYLKALISEATHAFDKLDVNEKNT
ncbi:MAG: helix-turn-helix transcriptional regulator [Oceanospirillaceae bacterium]|nr:helix-turn-helix transcriptional regulator [Oceanospirillaceae bacterium]